jgi:hypothetical protein
VNLLPNRCNSALSALQTAASLQPGTIREQAFARHVRARDLAAIVQIRGISPQAMPEYETM